jgi:hypothetical protein
MSQSEPAWKRYSKRGSANNQILARAVSFGVPVLRDPYFPNQRVRDPLEIYHRQQMKKHWIHDPPEKPACRRATPHGDSDEASQVSQDSRRPAGADEASFLRQLQETRQRSQRLHTDPFDLEGPGKFHQIMNAKQYTRELSMDDPMCGFLRGDTVALQPEGSREEFRGRADFDFGVVVGRAWEHGFVEVEFHSDRQVAAVKAEHLASIDRAETMARKLRFRKAGAGLLGDDVPGARRSMGRSASLPTIGEGPPRPRSEACQRGRRARTT